jgi:hypothetical protein
MLRIICIWLFAIISKIGFAGSNVEFNIPIESVPAVFDIEISSSLDFDPLLIGLSGVTQKNISIPIQASGAYYWRLTASGEQHSGSFLILPDSMRDQLIKMSWGPVENAEFYRLRFYDGSTRTLSVNTNQPQMMYKHLGGHVVHIIPKKGDHYLTRIKVVSPTVVELFTESAEQSPQAVGEQKAAPTSLAPAKLPDLIRPGRLFAGGKMFQESFTVIRNFEYESPMTIGLGLNLGAEYWLDYYNFETQLSAHGTTTTYEAGGNDTPDSAQKRFVLSFMAGADVLNIWQRLQSHGLVLGAGFRFGQYPIKEDNQSGSAMGGLVSYKYFGEPTYLAVNFYSFASRGSLLELAADYHWREDINLTFAIYQRQTLVQNSDAESRFVERGIWGAAVWDLERVLGGAL